MKTVSSARMREIEKQAIAEHEVSSEVLMDRAGMSVAFTAQYFLRLSGYDDVVIHVFAGRGNNGGDAFAAARYLRERDFDVEVWLACEASALSGDALTHFTRMKSTGVAVHELPTKADWDDAEANCLDVNGLVIDGLLGTGVSGPVRGPVAAAIRMVNSLGRRNPVISIDVPSGLNADTGRPEGAAVAADVTVTMGLPKTGLLLPCATDYTGSIEVADIGLPEELVSRVQSDTELITFDDLRGLIPRRPRASHKGSFGHVLVLAGSRQYSGAAALTAAAATRSGAGLVTALVPQEAAAAVASVAPEAIVRYSVSTPQPGTLSPDDIESAGLNLDDFTAIVVGPGLTTGGSVPQLVAHVVSRSRVPVVIDADALNVCAERGQILSSASAPLVLTPHPGEMARLLACTVAQVQDDRFGAVRRAAGKIGQVVVLKGAGTIVTAPDAPLHVNATGNPGMAKGGMGDVLAGLTAGLLAQGLAPLDAARLAVFVHGRSGDAAAWRTSQAGITASDLIDEIPGTFREISGR